MKRLILSLTAAAFLSSGCAFAQKSNSPVNTPPMPLPPAKTITQPPAVKKNLSPYKVIRTTPSMLEGTLNRLVNNGYAVTGILSTINQEKFTIIAFRPSPQ